MDEQEEKQAEQQALRQAYERVSKAVEGLSDKPVPTEVEDEQGNIDTGMKIPLAKVRAGDTRRLCLAISPDRKTDIVRALMKGTKDLAPDLIVQQQSTCLHHLLKVVKPFIPPAVIAQPSSETPRVKTPLEKFDETVPAPEGEEPSEDEDGPPQ